MESLGSLKSQWLTLDKIIKPKGLYEKFRVYAELKLRGRGKVVNLLENQWRGTLAYLVKCGEIKTTSDLYEFADNTDHYILNQASPRNLEVLKGIGPLTEIFKRISYFPDGQFLYSWFKPEVLSYLLEMEDVKNVEGLLVFFEKHKDKLEVFSRVDVEVIKRFCTFFNIKSLDQVGDVDLDTYIKTMHSLDRSGVDIEQIDPLVIYMGAIEDVQGDVLRVNSEIEKAKQVLGISRDSRNFQQDFKSILDYYYTESGLKKRLERLRPVQDVEAVKQKANELNALQRTRLKKEGKRKFAKELGSKDKGKRTLYLYIRHGHGQVDPLKTTAISYLLNQYVSENRSPVFTDFKIVPYSRGNVPREIFNMGIHTDQVISAVGDEFRNLNLGGNMIFLTHSNAREAQERCSVPIIAQGVMQSLPRFKMKEFLRWGKKQPDKFYVSRPFIPLRLFMDTQDWGSPRRYSDFESKDRGRNIETSMLAVAHAVYSLEEMLLGEIRNNSVL